MDSTVAGTPVVVNEGSGSDVVNVAPTNRFLDNIQGNVTVNGTFGNNVNTLTTYDQDDPYNDTYTLTGSSITRSYSALITFANQDLVVNGGSGAVTYNIDNTPGVATTRVNTGTGNDTINVLATGYYGTLDVVGGQSVGTSTINIGNGGSVQGLSGAIDLENPLGGENIINVNDSADTHTRNATISTLGANPSDSQRNTDYWGTLTGLAPMPINFEYTDTTSVTVDLPNAYFFNSSGNTVGSSITVTPVYSTVYNIHGNPNLWAPGNSLTVSNVNGTVVDHPTGTYQGYFTFEGSSTTLVNYTGIQSPTPIGLLVASTDAGISPEVKVYTAQTGDLKFDLHPFTSSFLGGVRVAVGDLKGDGVPDIITAEGSGSASDGDSMIQVFDGLTGQQLAGSLGLFDPFPGFHGGLWAASADLTGSGYADLIVGQGAGGQGLVNIYSGNGGRLLAQFQPYGSSFTDGVRVAAGPVVTTSSGHIDVGVVTGAGPGGAPLVDVFDGPSLLQGNDSPVASFNAFDPSFTGGVYVATGLISGQGKPPAEIVVGEGAGGEPRVSVFDGTGTQLQSFLAFDPGFHGGVRVATADVNGSGRSAIVAVQGPGAGSLPQVRAFDSVSLKQIDNFFAFPANVQNGLFVAGGGRWGLFHEVSQKSPSPSPSPPPPPVSFPPSPPPAPTLNVPPLLTLFDLLWGGTETVNADGSVTVTDSLFGFPLLVSTFDAAGKLESVLWLGFNVTLLFELL